MKVDSDVLLLSIWTIWDGLGQKTISRYCPFNVGYTYSVVPYLFKTDPQFICHSIKKMSYRYVHIPSTAFLDEGQGDPVFSSLIPLNIHFWRLNKIIGMTNSAISTPENPSHDVSWSTARTVRYFLLTYPVISNEAGFIC
jgi:hypothetical protein